MDSLLGKIVKLTKGNKMTIKWNGILRKLFLLGKLFNLQQAFFIKIFSL
jgi:hypothetical protein